MARPLILITNDDGIDSPGLVAAANASEPLGDLLIVAPNTQQSGMGRSMPTSFDGRISETAIRLNSGMHRAYGANASPAQAVLHALLEIADRKPSLLVSGINYGENVSTSITISGTVGAALEGAAHGIPALAVSLQVDQAYHLSNDHSVDFSHSVLITRQFASRWLAVAPHIAVDVLKIDIPAEATPDTEWRLTRLERGPYYRPLPSPRTRLDEAGQIGYEMIEPQNLDSGSDVAAILEGVISVTPLSLDMTSRAGFAVLAELLKKPENADPG
nr:5'/3'-nucleotidase SurE [Anaerolineae bacterium]